MRLLVDTHAFFWWLTDDQKLSARALDLLEDTQSDVLISPVVGWEIATKSRLGKWPAGHLALQDLEGFVVTRGLTPVQNKDYSTYITKVMQSGAKGCYVALQGDEARAFYSQAAQYGLSSRMPLFTEIVAQSNIKTLGKTAVGLLGGSRYAYTQDTPENKAFVAAFQKEHPGEFPDWTDGEMYQALDILVATIEKAKSTDTDKLIAAMEDIEVKSIKGPIKVRKCDHQGMNPGIVVKVVDGPKGPEPEIVKIYSPEMSTPECGKTTFAS